MQISPVSSIIDQARSQCLLRVMYASLPVFVAIRMAALRNKLIEQYRIDRRYTSCHTILTKLCAICRKTPSTSKLRPPSL